MTRLLEDFLTEEDRAAIGRVFSSYELRFDKLVQMAGLDPAEDFKYSDLRGLNFCGADLRGFDFTGSDLRQVVTDGRTLIDDTTTLVDAKLGWIEEQDIPIVSSMHAVENAQSSDSRKRALIEIEKRFGKTDHVVAFVINAAKATDNVEAFLDYADFLPPHLPDHQLPLLVDAGERLLKRRFAKSRSRTRREATTLFLSSAIIDRLEMAEGSFAATWYRSLATLADQDAMTNALKGTAVQQGKEALLASLKNLT